ncbi:RHTO0S04e11100g1_1 [Rhodotorula toruloides]|uniref:Arginine biosynthesis bifunctional protein ArgJ, mitochondrial n=1 Tax=Rhodotorula toruloides TaxID=5286 RepID=A0A061AWT7_RHOTO|nr:RHTO0S04e11100g1_1 [Rhodotorula toruloides]
MAGIAKAAQAQLKQALAAPAARLFSSASAAPYPASSSPPPAPGGSNNVENGAGAATGQPKPKLTKAQRFTLDPATASTAPKFPHGFLATGLHCGVKKDRSKLDLAVIISDRPCSAAGTFTRNAFVAAPVIVSQEVLARQRGVARGLVVNSGCANAVTGSKGLEDARAMSDQLDSFLSASSSSDGTGTLVMSTGVIGQLLPIDKIRQGIEASTATLGSTFSAWSDCARAFMTTDTFPKLRTRTIQLGGKEVRMVGIDKGAGMIHPNMGPPAAPHATMLGVIATDAAVEPASLQNALTYAVDRSFNSISVDGDMSTNDTVLVLANGASGMAEISEKKTPEEFVQFREELTSFAAELAQLVVRDGEGAEKFVKVTVQGAPSYEGAHKIASTVSTSSCSSSARCTARTPTGAASSALSATRSRPSPLTRPRSPSRSSRRTVRRSSSCSSTASRRTLTKRGRARSSARKTSRSRSTSAWERRRRRTGPATSRMSTSRSTPTTARNALALLPTISYETSTPPHSAPLRPRLVRSSTAFFV